MSSITDKGRIHTFWTLIQENPIVVPRVQRDFAYGRTDEKAIEVRTELLEKMKIAITGNESQIMTLDFVYGSIKPGIGMEPLDGQQRLTTLFLLHVYAAQREGLYPKELEDFTYQTRTTASIFCKKLVTGRFCVKSDDDDLFFDWNTTPSSQIIDSNAFLPTYTNDPTISAMLVVLDDIQKLFADVDDLWSKLTKTEQIRFYYLPLDKFGLSDDLFIKMNSRGKPLTNYELFKSKFEGFLEEKAKLASTDEEKQSWLTNKELFSTKLDGVWADMLWKKADNNVSNVDNGMLNLFNAIIQIRYCLNNDNCSVTEAYNYENTIVTISDFKFLIDFITAFEKKHETLSSYLESFFYTSDEVIGKSDRIRLFGRSKENIFITTIRGKLTIADYVLLYGVFLGFSQPNNKQLFQRFRNLRNLLANSQFELRGKKIGVMFNETRELIEKGEIPTQGFNKNQMQEEAIKSTLDSNLLKFENHTIFQGSLALFLPNSINVLEKFEQVFDENYIDNTPKIRSELLKWGDYSQYTKAMEKNCHKRYFLHKSAIWEKFLKINTDRHNQHQIIECLDKCSISLDSDIPFTPNDWQYYFIKYDDNGNVYAGGSQGVYNWDNHTTEPLVINVLNSSTHYANYDNSGYIEWNLLNRIFHWKYYQTFNQTLDYHGSSPIVISDANLSITAVQGGWKIVEFDDTNSIILRLIADGMKIENNVFLVHDADYIVEAEKLVIQILSYY
ncbi:MAG: GmrSD restriction endonuclease domain-containing protein [Phocaeicola sp.]